MASVSSPPALATIHVTEDARGLFVRIESQDVQERRRLISSFRYTFGPHGRKFSKPLQDGWHIPYWKRKRLEEWLSAIQTNVQWPGVVSE